MRDYLWANPVGRIRIIEKGLLTKSDLRKILETTSLDASLAALRDSFYGPYISKLENTGLFESALQKAVKDAHDGIMEISPEPLVVAAYRARYDFHNAKVLLKAEMFQVPAEQGAFSSLGNLSVEHLKILFDGAMKGQVPLKSQTLEPDSIDETMYEVTRGIMVGCHEIAQKAADKESSPFEVDSWIDKWYYSWAASVYKKYGYPALVEFIQYEIDILNLKMAIRAKLLGVSSLRFSSIVIAGGTLSRSALTEAYEQNYFQIARVYDNTGLQDLAEQGASLAEEKRSLTKWEKECDNVMIKLARESASICLGPEPVFGYMFGRETEVKNLRIILSGKQSLVPENEISERLRESYA